MGDPLLDAARVQTRNAVGSAPFLTPWLFEFTPASSESPRSTYLERVRNSDLVIWLVGSETTDPVVAEITTAIRHHIPLLVFQLSVPTRTSQTEELLSEVGPHSKWVEVDDVEGLGLAVQMTLSDEIVRAVRRRNKGRSPRSYVEDVGRRSRSRCIARWQGSGLSAAEAIKLTDNLEVGNPPGDAIEKQGLVLLVGPMGSGKSLTAERLLQSSIQNALSDEAAPLPIYLDATQIEAGLQKALDEEVRSTAWSHDDGATLVIDGLESLGSQRAVQLLEEVRIHCHTHPATRVYVTSRPLPALSGIEEAVTIPPLSEQESIVLINLAGRTDLSDHVLSDWPKSLREAIERPLFAILAGTYFGAYGRWPSNVVSLIDEVISAALAEVDLDRERLESVSRLAASSIEHGLGPVHAAEAALPPDIRSALTGAGLIVDNRTTLRFSLPLFAQWFAAQWLLDGNRAALDTLRQAESWSTSLAIATGKGGFEETFDQLDALVKAYPGLAGEVIDDALSRWGDEEDISEVRPSDRELGRVPTTMVSWIHGLGRIGQLTGPLTPQGLAPFAAQVYGTRLSTSWYFGDHPLEGGVPAQAFQGDWPWGMVLSASIPSGANWPWRWSMETLKLSLSNLISTWSLPTGDTFVEKEAAWSTALELIGRGRLFGQPIEIQELETKLLEMSETEHPILSGRRWLRLPELKRVIEQLRANGSQTFDPPLPGPDRTGGGWVWSPFSEQRLRERTIAVYENALQSYADLVEEWFSELKHVMPNALMLPVAMRGRLNIPVDSKGMGPVLTYYWEPVESTKVSIVDLDADVPRIPVDELPESIVAAIRRHRPEFAHRLYPTGAMTVLEIFGEEPVTRLVYRWLWEDLSSAGWLSGPAPSERARNIIGAKFAGMQVVRVEQQKE